MRNIKTTAELLLTWDMENLMEYRYVLSEKLKDYGREDEMSKIMYIDYIRTKNNLVVVMAEIDKRAL